MGCVMVLVVLAAAGLANLALHDVWVAVGLVLGLTWELGRHQARRERQRLAERAAKPRLSRRGTATPL